VITISQLAATARRPRRRAAGQRPARPEPHVQPGAIPRTVDRHPRRNTGTTVITQSLSAKAGLAHHAAPAGSRRMPTGRITISGPSTRTKEFGLCHVRPTMCHNPNTRLFGQASPRRVLLVVSPRDLGVMSSTRRRGGGARLDDVAAEGKRSTIMAQSRGSVKVLSSRRSPARRCSHSSGWPRPEATRLAAAWSSSPRARARSGRTPRQRPSSGEPARLAPRAAPRAPPRAARRDLRQRTARRSPRVGRIRSRWPR
jgi:hypothetical protein